MRITEYDLVKDENALSVLHKKHGWNYVKIDNLDEPENVVTLMNDLFYLNKLADEFMYCIALNSKLRPVGIFMVSKGTTDNLVILCSDVLVRVMLTGCYKFIIVHNHPSADPNPSNDDIYFTSDIVKSSNIIGLILLDHIIIAGSSFYSFARHNLIIKNDD